MAKSKELKRQQAMERQAAYDKKNKANITIPVTQVVNGLPINGAHLYVHRPEELLSFIEGGKNGEPEHEPEDPFVIKKDPAYEAMLKEKINMLFFLRASRLDPRHDWDNRYSWPSFLSGTNDQGGVNYARVSNNISF